MGARTVSHKCTIRTYAEGESTMSGGADPNGRYAREALPLDDVGRLVELLAESGVGEIRVRQGELEIIVKARTEVPTGVPAGSPAEPSAAAQVAPLPEAVPVAERDGGVHVVRSPVVGTFYRAPRPGEEPYVEVGNHVSVGQTLCIVEAMKLMNEIPTDIPGEVVEILVENARGVEYDQPLFRIQPEGRSAPGSLRSGE